MNRKEGNDQESIQLPNTFRTKTPKGKKDALKVTAPQSKLYKQKAKRTVSSKKWSNGYPKYKFHQDIHAKTYNDRYSKPQQKHRIGTVSNITWWNCYFSLKIVFCGPRILLGHFYQITYRRFLPSNKTNDIRLTPSSLCPFVSAMDSTIFELGLIHCCK